MVSETKRIHHRVAARARYEQRAQEEGRTIKTLEEKESAVRTRWRRLNHIQDKGDDRQYVAWLVQQLAHVEQEAAQAWCERNHKEYFGDKECKEVFGWRGI